MVLGARGPAHRCQYQRYKLPRRESFASVGPEALAARLWEQTGCGGPTVWALTCLFTRVGFRRRGVGRPLARAAVIWAREHGAVALEAYPLTTTASPSEELHAGTLGLVVAAGFTADQLPLSAPAREGSRAE